MEIAFFDLDKTIVARSSPLALGKSFFKEGLISRSLMLKSLYAQLMFHLMGADEEKMQRLQRESAKLTEGWDAARVKEIVGEVLEDVISPLIYSEALELIHDHREAGRLICIVSSAPEEIVQPLAKMLQVDRHIASKPRIRDGKYTGELDFYAYGPHKAEALRALAEQENADLENCFAYSDSITDLPMLEAVGHPVAVNPDKDLKNIAGERGWEIETFRNPVSLRNRLPDWNLRERVPDLHLRERIPEMPSWVPNLKGIRGSVETGVWVTVTVAGLAATAWWLARRSSPRSE